jgi:hypothetical protein
VPNQFPVTSCRQCQVVFASALGSIALPILERLG